MFCENTLMARTPEEKAARKAIAQDWNLKHGHPGGEGRKFLQHASAPRIKEVLPPPRPPRGPGLPHRLSDESWLLGVRRSKNVQAEIAQIVHESAATWQQRQEVSARLKDPLLLSTIVGDTNVILHAFANPGLPTCEDIVGLVKNGKVGLVVTDPIIREMKNKAQLPDTKVYLNDARLRDLDHFLSQFAINVSCLISGEPPERVLNDHSDTKYVTALLASGAEYLVSRDGHLLDFEPPDQDNLPIINPRVFLNIIRKRL